MQSLWQFAVEDTISNGFYKKNLLKCFISSIFISLYISASITKNQAIWTLPLRPIRTTRFRTKTMCSSAWDHQSACSDIGLLLLIFLQYPIMVHTLIQVKTGKSPFPLNSMDSPLHCLYYFLHLITTENVMLSNVPTMFQNDFFAIPMNPILSEIAKCLNLQSSLLE